MRVAMHQVSHLCSQVERPGPGWRGLKTWTLQQRETGHPRWPLRWFRRRVESRLRAQLIKRLTELGELLETNT